MFDIIGALGNFTTAAYNWGASVSGKLVNPERNTSNVMAKALTVPSNGLSIGNSVTRDNFASNILKGVQGTFEKIGQAVTGATAKIGSSMADAKARAVSGALFNNITDFVSKTGNIVTTTANTIKSAGDAVRGMLGVSMQDEKSGIAIKQVSATDMFSIPYELLPILFSQRDTGSLSGYINTPPSTTFSPTPVNTATSLPEPLANMFSALNPTMLFILAIIVIALLFMRKAQ